MKSLFAVVLLLVSARAGAEDAYVHGKDHCFHFNAPSGWVLDNISGSGQGVPMVLYPTGRSWADATTVIYSRIADFAPGTKTPQEKIIGQVNRVLDDFRRTGSGPALKATRIESITSKSGAEGQIWKFSGDKWGNLEMVAYFVGPATLNFFVMSSRDPKDFERSSRALIELASSYREANDCLPCGTAGTGRSCGKTVPGGR